ncbi:hypothetical protein ACIB24_14270 [Spongisporangium articulatum]|uniref:Uncharacterized protein n=1 Tax=Spongisporangium articulatum TaxID=3362603 RepID=A0ABW8APD3_9ACTN
MQNTPNARPGGSATSGVPADPAPRIRLFWYLLLAAFFVLQLQLPVRLAGGAFCLAAIWAGISSLNRLASVRRYAKWIAGPLTPPAPGYPAPPAPLAGDPETARRITAMAARRAWPVGLGLGLVAVLSFSVVADAAFYRVNADTEDCLAGANTEVARQRCYDDRQQRLQNIVDRLTNRLQSTPAPSAGPSVQPQGT